MYNVFKEPIICKLKPSYKLATGFLVITLLPIISLLILSPRYPHMVIIATVVLLICCIKLMIKHSIRSTGKGIKQLRLHNQTVLITHHNLSIESEKITRICAANDWIVLEYGNNCEKIILDEYSVGGRVYSQIRRQINLFETNDLSPVITHRAGNS